MDSRRRDGEKIKNDEPMDTAQNDCLECEKKIMECESKLKQRNIEYESIKKKQLDDENYYKSVLKRKDKDCTHNVHEFTNKWNSCVDCEHDKSTRIDDLELENDKLKLQNEELKKEINSKNQENKKLNTSQSIQKTIIIVGVLIILVLLGLCIYLYFYKH